MLEQVFTRDSIEQTLLSDFRRGNDLSSSGQQWGSITCPRIDTRDPYTLDRMVTASSVSWYAVRLPVVCQSSELGWGWGLVIRFHRRVTSKRAEFVLLYLNLSLSPLSLSLSISLPLSLLHECSWPHNNTCLSPPVKEFVVCLHNYCTLDKDDLVDFGGQPAHTPHTTRNTQHTTHNNT